MRAVFTLLLFFALAYLTLLVFLWAGWPHALSFLVGYFSAYAIIASQDTAHTRALGVRPWQT